MLLSTGRVWFLEHPWSRDMDIEDIAHALSHLCRFGGHCREFYSVAQHCVLAYREAKRMNLSKRGRRAVLLHDASEAYLVDVPRPLKFLLPKYREMEAVLQCLVASRFQTTYPHPPYVTSIDDRMLVTEQAALMPPSPAYLPDVEPFGILIGSWGPEVAKACFLEAYNECKET